jgi:hypothetical protein
MTNHPCENNCPNFTDEQCCHCLIQESTVIQTDEEKHLKNALKAVEYIP